MNHHVLLMASVRVKETDQFQSQSQAWAHIQAEATVLEQEPVRDTCFYIVPKHRVVVAVQSDPVPSNWQALLTAHHVQQLCHRDQRSRGFHHRCSVGCSY